MSGLWAGCPLHDAGRLLYADPHPGYYLFRDDGRLGLLDFGCVRPYTDVERECIRLADVEYAKWMWRPDWHDGPFHFGDLSYLRGGVERYVGLVRARISPPGCRWPH